MRVSEGRRGATLGAAVLVPARPETVVADDRCAARRYLHLCHGCPAQESST